MSGSSAMPSFIFSNACQSARTSDLIEKQNKSLLGLANAFLFAGVNHYLGTTWSIPDDSSAQFAYEFYTHLFQGKSIGESVKQARAYFIDNNDQNNFIWTSYILYGDPRYTYFTKDEKIQKKIKFKPSAYRKRTLRGLFNYAWDTDQLIKKMIFILLFIGIVGGIALSYLYLSYLKTQHIHKQLVNQAYQHQQRVDRLTKEFCQKWPDSFHYSKASPDGWTSTQLPVAMMFDSHQFIQGRENLILFALQDEMLEQLTFIKLLERKSIDKLLEEWIKADIKPALSLPKLIIFLEIHNDISKTYVLMRLVENWDQVIDNLFEEISSDNIFSQKKKLSEKIIQTLIARYPIKGLIFQKNDNEYWLNIGSIEGVRLGQSFKGIDSNRIFTVMSTGLKESKMVLKSGEPLSTLRLKVIKF
jgi:type II secretory pathway pseudopilin PulG